MQEETAALQKFVRGSSQKVHLHLALHMKQALLDEWGRRQRIPYCATFSLCGMQEVAAVVAANEVVAVAAANGVAAAAIVAAAVAVAVVVAAVAAVDAIEQQPC